MADIIQIDKVNLKRIHKDICKHEHLYYDPMARHIECEDCGRFIEPFDAFMILVDYHRRGADILLSRQSELKELEEKSGKNLLKATRTLDSVWRSKMLPTCPHCKEAIAPEDGFGRFNVNRKMEMERRKFKQSGIDPD
jgi:hypothetical protein